MSDEPILKLYAVAFLAKREDDGGTTLRVKPGVVLAFSEDEALREGMGGAFAAIPESEGWKEHQVILTEVPSNLRLGAYELTWHAEKDHT
jgi:hypothetical protein